MYPVPDDDEQLDELERQFHGQPGDDDEDLRGTHLARKLAKRRGYGLPARERQVSRSLSSWALLAIAGIAAWSLYGLGAELAYWLVKRPPVELGRMGAYADLEKIPDGAFVRLQGIASPKRAAYSRFFAQHEVFPLIASRLLVDRASAPDEAQRGFGFQYAGEGRLTRAGERYSGVREQFAQLGELPKSGEVWIVEDGVAPRRGLRIPLEGVFWLAMLGGALGVVVRRWRRARVAGRANG